MIGFIVMGNSFSVCSQMMTLSPESLHILDDFWTLLQLMTAYSLASFSSVVCLVLVFWQSLCFVCVGGGAQDGYTAHRTCHAHQKRMYLVHNAIKPTVSYLVHTFLRSINIFKTLLKTSTFRSWYIFCRWMAVYLSIHGILEQSWNYEY